MYSMHQILEIYVSIESIKQKCFFYFLARFYKHSMYRLNRNNLIIGLIS